MRFHLVSVGRERSDPTAPLVADYVNRISKFHRIEDLVLKPQRIDKIASRMFKEAKKGEILVALDEHGKEFDSAEFARLMSSWMNRGISRVTFVIGGAEGLPDEVKQNADYKLSLSRMTLPHRLARLFLGEQIYRALCNIQGIPYQK
ncbi:MAG: 23S rRNA (pseudouridine(1915)-N(3))-methyltransferase RlmH [Proteobacteria bacterium]|nr:23S rRNA (pseudouridine(1915)-N(3))-methyltransferase RlmH [Pseudomonadota bacterium]